MLSAARARSAEDAAVRPLDAAPDRRTRKREEAQARQQRSEVRRPYLKQQAAIEAAMAAQSAEKTGLDAWLALPEAYADDARDRLKVALARQGELAWSLARLEAQWLEIAEALDRIA